MSLLRGVGAVLLWLVVAALSLVTSLLGLLLGLTILYQLGLLSRSVFP